MANLFLAATINYLDLAIGLFFVFGVAWGLIRGLTKTIRKSFILVVVISMMLSSVIAPALEASALGEGLRTQLNQLIIQNGGEVFTQELYYIDGTYYVYVEGVQVELKQAISALNVPMLNLIGLFIPMILKGESGISVIDKIIPSVSKAVFIVASFIILCIVIKIIFVLINMFIKQVLDRVDILRWLDRLLGALITGIKSVLFIFVAMSIISVVAGMDIEGVELLNEQINSSVLGKWLIENNVLSNILASVFS